MLPGIERPGFFDKCSGDVNTQPATNLRCKRFEQGTIATADVQHTQAFAERNMLFEPVPFVLSHRDILKDSIVERSYFVVCPVWSFCLWREADHLLCFDAKVFTQAPRQSMGLFADTTEAVQGLFRVIAQVERVTVWPGGKSRVPVVAKRLHVLYTGKVGSIPTR